MHFKYQQPQRKKNHLIKDSKHNALAYIDFLPIVLCKNLKL